MRKFHAARAVLKNPYYFVDLQCQIEKHPPNHRTFDPLANAPSEPMAERVKKVFGKLGSREESRREAQLHGITVGGIHVPSFPEEPTNCCMSGCVNCVWELYREEVMEFKEARNKARAVLMEPKYRHVPWPPLLGPEPEGRTTGTTTGAGTTGTGTTTTTGTGTTEATGTTTASTGTTAGTTSQVTANSEDDMGVLSPGIKAFIETEKRIRARREARQKRK